MKILLAGLSCFLSIAAAATLADTKGHSLKFACNEFPPYNFQNGPYRGINVDIIHAALEAVGRSVTFEFFPWKRAVSLVKTGEYDALCGCSYQKEREKNFIFSGKLSIVSHGVFRKKHAEKKPISSLSDLKGSSVGTIQGYVLQKELQELKIAHIGVKDETQLVKMLATDRIEVIYAYRDIILYNLTKVGYEEPLEYTELASQPNFVCFSKKTLQDTAVIGEFNKGLREIQMSGQDEKIRSKYLAMN